ncbi:hypothetical protein ASF43_23865 [Pseudorhodoferax sp. Leaf267]|nr:hypothetical protein ASF43_23865 [Pseudorhodoferax sp. Leaf267]
MVALALGGCNTMPQAGAGGGGGAAAPAPMVAEQRGPDGCKYLPQSRPAPATTNTQNAVIGAAVGAVAGAAIGRSSARTRSVGTRNGALIGAVAGALAGSQFNNVMGMTEQADGSVKLDIPGKVLFKTGNADISPDFQSVLTTVGGTIREWCGVTATVVGHTDSTGSPTGNQRLSERRAAAVVTSLRNQGLDPSRLSSEGRGQNEPIADNSTEDGRSQNRRVEIFIRPPVM